MRPPAVILHAPQMAENIGAVARAMANFGLEDLRLVKPRDGWPQRRAWATSSGAHWPLENAQVFERTEDAIADLRLVHAATARPRETALPVLTPSGSSAALHEEAAQDVPTGILFGGERAGLETEDIALCQAIVTIPIEPRFASLNLAQAVVVNAYAWRTHALDAPPPAFREAAPPAEQASMLGLYEHLEGELEFSGFFFPPEKKPSMVRNLRVMLGRARLSEQEVRTFRGVVTALTKGRGRVLARMAEAARTPGEAEGDA
jgi:tRNA/rRNA methyltransferase